MSRQAFRLARAGVHHYSLWAVVTLRAIASNRAIFALGKVCEPIQRCRREILSLRILK